MLVLGIVVLALVGTAYGFASRPVVFFDITADGDPIGTIMMELRADVVPKTAENFRQLCTGENGYGYKGSSFFRIIPGVLAQGGDITSDDGTGGKSIYGDEFADENFTMKHTGGFLSMANTGPDTNRSQFFIVLGDNAWMNGVNVVFGMVTQGMAVLKKIESFGSDSGEPQKKIVIADCGQL